MAPGKKQITKAEGYDGGAVFSRDGSKIFGGRIIPILPKSSRLIAISFKGQPDGSHEDGIVGGQQRRVERQFCPDYGCASFAPTFSPDGKKILFSPIKQKCDSRDFELYTHQSRWYKLTGTSDLFMVGLHRSRSSRPTEKEHRICFRATKVKANYEFNVFYSLRVGHV